MSDWRQVTLGDIASLSNGSNFTKKAFGSGLKILGVRDFGDRTSPEWEAMDEVDPTALSSNRQLLAEGDLVFVRSNGNPALVGRSMLITQGPTATHSAFTIKARPDTDLVAPRFLGYQMRYAHRAGLMRAANGTNITNLSQAVLSRVPVLLPSRDTQLQVQTILGSIDDLIENNRRRVEVLEEMARSIYREWFVHFRYPSHETVPLVDSPRGPIPEGWSVTSLGQAADITMGQSPKSEFYNDEGIGSPFHQGVTGFGANFPSTRKWCSAPGRSARDGDILVSVRAPVGRLNVADVEMTIGRGLGALRAKDGRQGLLLGHMRQVFAEEDSMGGGTIYKAIGKQEFSGIILLVAPTELSERAESLLADNLGLIKTLTYENRRLTAMRDLLLPRLVTGQIDVSTLDLDGLLEGAVA